MDGLKHNVQCVQPLPYIVYTEWLIDLFGGYIREPALHMCGGPTTTVAYRRAGICERLRRGGGGGTPVSFMKSSFTVVIDGA